jgi:hypothetical protein
MNMNESVPYNHFEYSALRWQAEQKIKPDYVFLLHDTCTVTGSFWDKIKEIKTMTNLTPDYSMNCGVYPTNILPNMLDFIKPIDNKVKAMLAVDFIFNRQKNNWFGYQYKTLGYVDFYQTGHLREIVYYPDTGIIKYQANNGKQPRPIVIL